VAGEVCLHVGRELCDFGIDRARYGFLQDRSSGRGRLVARLWNGWDHPLTATLNDIKAADVTKDATIHLIIPEHRRGDLHNAIVARDAATTGALNRSATHPESGLALVENASRSVKRSCKAAGVASGVASGVVGGLPG
jgi:hypothetical protein